MMSISFFLRKMIDANVDCLLLLGSKLTGNERVLEYAGAVDDLNGAALNPGISLGRGATSAFIKGQKALDVSADKVFGRRCRREGQWNARLP